MCVQNDAMTYMRGDVESGVDLSYSYWHATRLGRHQRQQEHATTLAAGLDMKVRVCTPLDGRSQVHFLRLRVCVNVGVDVRVHASTTF